MENLTIPGEKFEKRDYTRLTNRKDTYEAKDIPKDVKLQTLEKIKERLKVQTRSFSHSLKYRGEICIVSLISLRIYYS